MRGEFIAPSDRRWREALARTGHDIYHTPEYVTVAARYENAIAAAYYIESSGAVCLVPLLIRDLPDYLGAPANWRDAVSPYGYSGPLVAGRPDRLLLRSMLQAMTENCRDAGLVSAFIRCHPLLSPEDEGDVWPAAVRVKEGDTVYIDLTEQPAQLWRQMRANHRKQIDRLDKSGFVVAIDEWQRLSAFLELYTETMRRRNAGSYYIFPCDYFLDLRAALGNRLHLFCVISPEGSVAAAGLFTDTAGIVQYHLGGSASDYLPQAPSKLLMYSVLQWAKERGRRVFHLGGGRGCVADSLFGFKAGFSNLRASFCTYRLVLDAARYVPLVKKANALFPDRPQFSPGFFPQYRATTPVVRQIHSRPRSQHTSAEPQSTSL